MFTAAPGARRTALLCARRSGQARLLSVEHEAKPSRRVRTRGCGELRSSHDGEVVTLSGWISNERRISKSLSFIPIRDMTGSTQLVLRNTTPASEHAVTPESVVLVTGTVRSRPSEMRNSGMSTGDIEVEVTDIEVLNPASTELPFLPTDAHNLPSEELRARYRYLDLRRPELARNIQLRSKVAHAARCYLHDHNFTEVETPILLRSTPEGAREFLVPTRRTSSASEPQFFALQQSPQQPKQLLMASGGVERYFQLARCFRDEDSRKDRQPEFTQIDLEMAFVSDGEGTAHKVPGESRRYANGKWRIGGQEVRDVVEGAVAAMWQTAKGTSLPRHFPVMTYHEAMTKYGSDKPDLRFGLEIESLSERLQSASPEQEAGADLSSAVDMLIYRPQSADGQLSSKAFDEIQRNLDGSKSSIERFKCNVHSPHELAAVLLKKSAHVRSFLELSETPAIEVDVHAFADSLADLLKAEAGSSSAVDVCHVFVAQRKNPVEGGSTALGDLRLRLAQALLSRGTIAYSPDPHFLWVTEFPLFTRADEDKEELSRGRWSSSHHPFTAPMTEDLAPLLESLRSRASSGTGSDAGISAVRGQHYDLVLNGQEIGGGSVRIHRADLQETVLKDVLELSSEELSRFGHLLHALKCGAPPHAGLAIGFDRFMSILCDTRTIRDVIAFPKASSGADLLFRSPAPARGAMVLGQVGTADEVLERYGLRVRTL